MVDVIVTIVNTLNSLTPLGFAAGLGYIIYQLTSNKGAVKSIADNHLSDLPEMIEIMRDITQTLRRIELAQSENFGYIKARLNGRGGV